MIYILIALLIILLAWYLLAQEGVTINNKTLGNYEKKLPFDSGELVSSKSVNSSNLLSPADNIQESNAVEIDANTSGKSLLRGYANSIQSMHGATEINTLRLSADDFLRRYNAGERCFNEVDLTGASLQGLYIIGVNLRGAVLRKACLSRSSFLASDLAGADLREADLSHTSFVGSNLSNSNLSYATLIETDLTSADLSHSLLQGIDISRAIIYQTKMEGINPS